MREKEYTDDRVPITRDMDYVDGPDTYSDYTEENDTQWREDVKDIANKELGMLTESELLRESPVYDDDLGRENLENDFESDEFDKDS